MSKPPIEIRYLRMLQGMRASASVFGYLLRGHLLRWTILVGFLGLMASIEIWKNRFLFTPFIAGMVVGIVLADIGRCRISAKLWNLNQSITDWPRVESMIAALTLKDSTRNESP